MDRKEVAHVCEEAKERGRLEENVKGSLPRRNHRRVMVLREKDGRILKS